MEEYTIKSVIRGHHVYKSNWNPTLGEQLILERKDGNSLDRHTVSVMKGGAIIGHIPRELLVHTQGRSQDLEKGGAEQSKLLRAQRAKNFCSDHAPNYIT